MPFLKSRLALLFLTKGRRTRSLEWQNDVIMDLELFRFCLEWEKPGFFVLTPHCILAKSLPYACRTAMWSL